MKADTYNLGVCVCVICGMCICTVYVCDVFIVWYMYMCVECVYVYCV